MQKSLRELKFNCPQTGKIMFLKLEKAVRPSKVTHAILF